MKSENKISKEKALEKDIRLKSGNRIKIERERKGYTQEYMANHLDISESHYSNIETGKRNCTMLKLVKICETLEISANDVLRDFVKTESLTDTANINKCYEKMSSEERKCLLAIVKAYCENTKGLNDN